VTGTGQICGFLLNIIETCNFIVLVLMIFVNRFKRFWTTDHTDEHGKIFEDFRVFRPFRVVRVPHPIAACAGL
jgi:hypothetical protein